MHALLVAFHCQIPVHDLLEGFASKLDALKGTEGLIMKTFMYEDTHRPRGFYVFTSREHAERYIGGAFFKGFNANPAISDVNITHFTVADGPSTAVGTPSDPMARSAALDSAVEHELSGAISLGGA